MKIRTITAAAWLALLIGSFALLQQPLRAAPAVSGGAPIPLTGTWIVDPIHSNVNFSIQHLGIGLVRGRFDDIAGTVHVDEKRPEASSVQFTIQATSIDTNVKMRDDDLRSKNYFDVAQYPTITFQSTRIEPRSARGPGRHYTAYGALTIHGVTKQVALPFDFTGPIHDPFGGVRFGVLTHTRLSRSDYGVGGHDLLTNGSMAIGNDVDIDISLEAVPPPKPA